MKPLKEFKIRCHALSEIMAGSVGLTDVQAAKLKELSDRKDGHIAGTPGIKPLTDNMWAELGDLIRKRDNPQLPSGAKTYCKKWMKENLFNRRKEWKAIVVDKGLMCELDGIKLLSLITGIEMEKNDEFFDNEFMEGSPDILIPEWVKDTKLSWDLFTFPMFDDVMPDDGYDWQLQGYMILTGKPNASVDYCLIDTPMALVTQDLKKLYFQSGGKPEDWNPETYSSLLPNYRFDDIPKELRVKSFEIKYKPELKEKIKERVLMCREYIAEQLKDPKFSVLNETV